MIRSVLEYASPVWAALQVYLSDLLEHVQKKSSVYGLPWSLL